MFFDPAHRDRSLLPHDPVKAILAPRPIGWITSMSAKGEINLAPYSYFNGVATHPPMVMFASDNAAKDSLTFIAETKEFVCNLATWDLRHEMNQTSATLPRGVNEMETTGLAAAPSHVVKPPRVAASPCALECKLVQIMRLTDFEGRPLEAHMTIGQVVGVYIEDRFIKDGILDTAAMKPIARCGYHDYAVVEDLFQMRRPK